MDVEKDWGIVRDYRAESAGYRQGYREMMDLESKEARVRKAFDISFAQYEELKTAFGACGNAGSCFTRYNQQRQNAKRRGIKWRITFREWWEAWQASGKYHLYGCGHGKYVMSRLGDAGAYEVGNISIITAVENNSNCRRKMSSLPTGVYRNNNSFSAHKTVGGVTHHIGTFSTPKEASSAYIAFMPSAA